MTSKNIILELLGVSSGIRTELSEKPSDKQWEEAFQIARKHTIIGVLAPTLDIIDNSQRPELGIYLKWQYAAEKIKEISINNRTKAKELFVILSQFGLHSCVLKGSAFARYYSDSLLRQNGDIDIWVEGGHRKVLHDLEQHFEVRDIFYHHCSINVFKDIDVEAHFIPSWMNSPFLNMRLQHYFKSKGKEQFSNYNEDLGFCVPTPAFSCILSFIHTFRHIFQEGVGLRQVMDCYQILVSLNENERYFVSKELKKIGLRKFSSALMYILDKVFGLNSDKFLFESDPIAGEFLLKDILSSGNFGIHSKNAKKLYSKNLLTRAFSKISRLSEVSRFSHREAFWAPFFKIWQKFWRKYVLPSPR